jgi:hypothetical protein
MQIDTPLAPGRSGLGNATKWQFCNTNRPHWDGILPWYQMPIDSLQWLVPVWIFYENRLQIVRIEWMLGHFVCSLGRGRRHYL